MKEKKEKPNSSSNRGGMSKGKDICWWGNFFYKSRSKELAQKNIFYFVVSMLRVLSRFSLPKAFEIFYW